jgi:hypothetical protein
MVVLVKDGWEFMFSSPANGAAMSGRSNGIGIGEVSALFMEIFPNI